MVGDEGLIEADAAISAVYQEVKDAARFKLDKVARRSIARVRQLSHSGTMNRQRAAQLGQIIDNHVVGKATQFGTMSGHTFKTVDSDLGALAAQYRRSPDADGRLMADGIREVQRIMRKALVRSNPGTTIAPRMRAADKAYSRLLRVEEATRRAKGNEGVWTAAQLDDAVRKFDISRHKRVSTEGLADMQDLSGAGRAYLTSRVGNPGTADRVLLNPIGMAVGGALGLPAALSNSPTMKRLFYEGAFTRHPALRKAGEWLMRRPGAVGGGLGAGAYLGYPPDRGPESGTSSPTGARSY
jgi:hypothetical protein